MRVHPNQVNANAQLDAVYAAQNAAAKREAARTRKKLLECASELTAEAEPEACIVRLGSREGSREPAREQNQQKAREGKEQEEELDAEGADNSLSD